MTGACRVVGLGFVAAALAACQPGQRVTLADGLDALTHEVVAEWRVPRGTAVLRRNKVDGRYDVAISGNRSRVSLQDYRNVRLQEVRDVGATRLAVLIGDVPGCTQRYLLLEFGPSDGKAYEINRCGRTFSVESDSRAVLFTEVGAPDPELWALGDRRLAGPVLRSALATPAPTTRAAQPAPRAASVSPPPSRPASPTTKTLPARTVERPSPPPPTAAAPVVRPAAPEQIPATPAAVTERAPESRQTTIKFDD